MTTPLRHLWKHHPVALSLFGAAAVLAVIFALRVALFTFYWADPDHRHQSPEPWMTPGYIAHSWHVPVEEVFTAIGLTARPEKKRMSLEQIAERRGEDPARMIADLEAFLASRAPRP